ncbi:MAG: DUF1840 domain-containing protein [Gammaproteobacteria bacterium]|jgi:hypothetical protein
MLIKFYSKVGSFTMFGDIAKQLLKMMGHSGTVPGAVRAADLAEARQRLESAVAAADSPPSESEADKKDDDDDDDEKPPVTLRQRAYPLIDLLKRAQEEDCDVLWDKG